MSSVSRVLLIDDERQLVFGLKTRLRAQGYNVLTASTGEEGLASAIEHRPDAIVLDVRMPGMDGLSVLRELCAREETQSTPVIMLSASLVDQRTALDMGARFFLQKPYDHKTLVAALESVIHVSLTSEREPEFNQSTAEIQPGSNT